MKEIRDRLAINIDVKFHLEFENLKKDTDQSYLDRPFEDFREIFLTSAIIGAANDVFMPIDSKKIKIFDSNVFNEHFDLPLLYTIAFCKEENPELLSDEKYILKIVEGYANGGFPILIDQIKNGNSSTLMNLAIHIKELIEAQS